MTRYATRDEAMTPQAIRDGWDTTCPMTVTRDGEAEPCGRPTQAVVAFEWDGSWWVSAMCISHAYRCHWTANGAPLPQIEGPSDE